MKDYLEYKYKSFAKVPKKERLELAALYPETHRVYVRWYRYFLAQEQSDFYESNNSTKRPPPPIPPNANANVDDYSDLEGRVDIPLLDSSLVNGSMEEFQEIIEDADFTVPAMILRYLPDQLEDVYNMLDRNDIKAMEVVLDEARQLGSDEDDDEDDDVSLSKNPPPAVSKKGNFAVLASKGEFAIPALLAGKATHRNNTLGLTISTSRSMVTPGVLSKEIPRSTSASSAFSSALVTPARILAQDHLHVEQRSGFGSTSMAV